MTGRRRGEGMPGGPGGGRPRGRRSRSFDAAARARAGEPAARRRPGARSDLVPERGGHRRFGAEAHIRRALEANLPTLAHERVVIAHLGPTNSGKTHASLEELVRAGAGAYGAPLRMLAQEVHDRLGARLGPGRVGLRTGEERVDEGAPILSCTTELLPPRDVVVVDEVHWLADAERGDAWTRALLSLESEELHLVGSPDVLPLLRAAVPGLELRLYDRLAPLAFAGTVDISRLEPGTVVVAFSRKAVLGLAREVSRLGHSVAVLYGAMPVAERRHQAERFRSGEADVMCATDVLGHGVNLPARTVLFAETTKWDGRARVELAPWEVAQIAGRAGRFGMHTEGLVGVLAGHGWARPSGHVVQRGLVPTVELEPGVRGFRTITHGRLGPDRRDLGDLPPTLWTEALGRWGALAKRRLRDGAPWLRVADVAPIIARLDAVGPAVLERLGPDDAWAFALAPIDVDKPGRAQLLRRLAMAAAGGSRLHRYVDPSQLEGASVTEAEDLADLAATLRWFTRRFPGAGGITSGQADALETAAAEVVARSLEREIRSNAYGTCVDCGRPAVPGRPRCDACHAAGQDGRDR